MPEPAKGLELSADVHDVSRVMPIYQGGSTLKTLVREVEPYSLVRLLWLSRNFGQHPATLAGMASS